MAEPIDIIIPWVNPADETWKKEFEHYKKIETGNTDPCRFRDWGFIKYVFRSIEQNCPWVRYVFLVLASETQIPDWLNVNHPKLKIVYHRDYIPAEFLPTFNSNIIELFYSRIPELSENFILCNDDVFFCQPKPPEFFFKNNKPVNPNASAPIDGTKWGKTLSNTLRLSQKLVGGVNKLCYNGHLPVSYKKSVQQFVLSKIDMYKLMCPHRFRELSDIMHFLFLDIQNKIHQTYKDDACRGRLYNIGETSGNIDFNQPLICLNECERSSKQAILSALAILDEKFSKKSNFEK